MNYVAGRPLIGGPLVDALIKEGLVPEECGDIEILMPINGAIVLSYRVFVRDVDLIKLSRAFAAAGEAK
jgi:hypothetical protein